jgi:hypothetical protein
LEGIAFFPISVGKIWTKRGKGVKHRKNTKKVWQVYGFMQDWDDDLHFTSFRINYFQSIWYRFNKAKVVERYCEYCENTSQFVCNRWDNPKECGFCEEGF